MNDNEKAGGLRRTVQLRRSFGEDAQGGREGQSKEVDWQEGARKRRGCAQ